MRVTSVLGHIMNYDYPESCKGWKTTPYETLYTIDLEKNISSTAKDVVRNIKEASKGCSQLIIWTDCDREGEAIGFDVLEACQKASKHLKVWRAHFSTVAASEIREACQNLREPDKSLADAVNMRQELDLRIGASFTRFQTIMVQTLFPQKYGVISYGPCQFPTLGFIVERYQMIRDFKPEPFYFLDCHAEREIKEPGGIKKVDVKFEWERGKIFDEQICIVLTECCLEAGKARVVSCDKKVTRRRRPFPLNTLELQKAGSRKLNMAGHKIMEIAEKLYNKGFISYPRTETASYSPNINIKDLVSRQTGSSQWGDFAKRLVDNTNGLFCGPLHGKGDDKAHPPIHPIKLVRYFCGFV